MGSHPTGEAYVPFLAHSNALSLHRHLVAASGLFPLALTGPAPTQGNLPSPMGFASQLKLGEREWQWWSPLVPPVPSRRYRALTLWLMRE